MPDEGISVTDWWELEDVLCTSQAKVKRGVIGYKMIGHDGPCLVLLHGAFGFSYIWQNLVQQLKETQMPLRLLLLDFYGRGHSPWPDNIKECTVSVLEQQVFDLLTHLRVKGKLLLVGYDIGATVAACFGSKHPEMVAGVVQLGPRGMLRELDETENTVRGSIIGRYLFSFRAKELLEDAHRKEFFSTKPGTQHWDLMELHVRMIAWQLENTTGYLTALASTLTHYPFHDSHAYKLIYGEKPLDFSVMILHGEEDQLYNGKDFRREIDNMHVAPEKLNVIRLSNCGHCVVLEQADDVAAILYDLLKVVGPEMEIPDPRKVIMPEPIVYVEHDTEEDHTQIFENITLATKAPHVPAKVDAGIAYAAMIDAKGVLVERLHRIRNNQRRLQAARVWLEKETKAEDMDLLQVEAAIVEGVAAFKQASESEASCYCEHCAGWIAELEDAEKMLGSIARRRAEVDVMAFLGSPEERAKDEQRRQQVDNERFGPWVPTPAPSLGPSRGAESEGSVTSVPAEPVDERRKAEEALRRKAAEERRSQVPSQETVESAEEQRRFDRRSHFTKFSRETQETQETQETRETRETRESLYSAEQRRYDRRYDRQSQLTGPSQNTVETTESAEQRRFDKRSQHTMDTVETMETMETIETLETIETQETDYTAEDRRFDRRSQFTDESYEDRRFNSAGLPPLPTVHVHYDFTKPVPVVETVDERALRERRERASDEGVYGSQESDYRRQGDSFRSQGSGRRRKDDRYDGRRREDDRRYVSPQRRDERRYAGNDRRYDDRRYDDRRYNDSRYEKRYDKRSVPSREEQRSRDTRSDERRYPSRDNHSREELLSRETRSMETKSRETRSMETMSLEYDYDEVPE